MINLQSDLMNMPTQEMWDAMQEAKLGWVIDREDGSVIELEKTAARMLGKEAALFILTGRMACLIALMTYCERGNQIILEKNSHIAWSQEWGLSFICGLYPRLIEGKKGIMDPEEIRRVMLENRFKHVPKTDLVCLENTHNMAGGAVMSVKQTEDICKVVHEGGAKVFIDGCRIFHSAAAQGVKPSELAAPGDGVIFSLIKGICGHGGALLCGTSEDIEKAYLNLKRIGAASFHRAGMLAASGLVALETMTDRLKDDILRAKEFAILLSKVDRLKVDLDSVQSNIVMADISATGLESGEVLKRLEKKGVRGHKFTEEFVRFTFHRQISDDDVKASIEAISGVTAEL